MIDSSFSLSYYIYNKVKENGFEKLCCPIKIGLKITNKCMFNCSYCFVDKCNNKDISLKNIKSIFYKLPQLPYEVYLTGGEPTLNSDFINIVDYLNGMGIKLKLHTTGIISKKVEKYILDNNIFESIQVSMDSVNNFNAIRPSKNNYTIYDVLKFTHACLKNKIKIIVNIVLSRLNINELDDILNFCKNNNLFTIRFTSVFTNDRDLILDDEEHFEYIFNIMKKYNNLGVKFISDPFSHPWSLALKNKVDSFVSPLYCPAQKTEFEIDMHGDVYPCPFLHDKYHRMGNLIYDEFEKVWNSGVDKLKYSRWSENRTCIKCSSYELCGGGCYAFSYIMGNSYDERCMINDNK